MTLKKGYGRIFEGDFIFIFLSTLFLSLTQLLWSELKTDLSFSHLFCCCQAGRGVLGPQFPHQQTSPCTRKHFFNAHFLNESLVTFSTLTLSGGPLNLSPLIQQHQFKEVGFIFPSLFQYFCKEEGKAQKGKAKQTKFCLIFFLKEEKSSFKLNLI